MSHETIADTDDFTIFEHQGWERACAGYEAHFGRLTRQSATALLDAAQVTGGQRVLDACCGPGMVTAAAAARGADALGLDFSAATVELATRLVPQATFHHGDAQALPFDDAQFDAVVCGFGIIHLAQPRTALAEIYRVLKPGGRVAISVWQAPGPGNGFGLLYGTITAHANMNVPLPEGPDFFQFSGPGALERALAEPGFREPSTIGVDQVWEFDRETGLVDAFLEGAVRARGLIMAQSEAVRGAIVAGVADGMQVFRATDGIYRLPMPALVGSGLK
jgi:SAM-dependent methyltransferase